MADEPLTWRIGSRSVGFIEPIGAGGRPRHADGLVQTHGDADRRHVAARRERPHRGRDLAVRRDGHRDGPVADAADVRAALDRAEDGAVTWRRTPALERMRILLRAAELADERAAQTAQVISAEAGKTIAEARGEAAARVT